MNQWISVRAKIRKENYIEMDTFCKASGTNVSAYIRNLIEENKPGTVPINKAGVNEFKFNHEKDRFTWGIRYDDQSYREIAENLSLEFLENLQKAINHALSVRNEYIQKRMDESIAIPTNIKKLKGGGENVKS
jgi:hypothetical protein